MPSPRVVETDPTRPHLRDQRRGLHPRPLLRLRLALHLRPGAGLLVLLQERQDAMGRVILKDDLALRRQLLQTLEDRMATIPYEFSLLPLRGIGYGHAN